ncbi:extracellular calcium-sensing receptor-like [Anneissia japonica]|uniref:extracellular calcium-sensing receptor-like n=1 Tax=Anneissia japonica TaxID=1529436 RepID=UPI00142589C7|nr:extracellular calcium-sensing receptor-like [Anneissia japonica]
MFFGSVKGEQSMKTRENHTNHILILGGLFSPYENSDVYNSTWEFGEPLESCIDFNIAFFIASAVAKFAVEEINNNSSLTTMLKYHEIQYCNTAVSSIEGILNLMNETNLKAIVTGATSESFIPISQIASLRNIPTIASYATSDSFSREKHIYRTSFRSVSSDRHQSRALAELSFHFDWKWIGAVAIDNEYGRNGLHDIVKEVENREICVAFQVYIHLTYFDKHVESFLTILNNTSNLEVVYFYTTHRMNLHKFFKRADEFGIKPCVWIASEGWSYLAPQFYKYNVVASIIGIDIAYPRLPGLLRYKSLCDVFERNKSTLCSKDLQKWLCKEKLQKKDCDFCTYLNVTNSAGDINKLFEYYTNYGAYSTYLAIQAIARALQDIEDCTEDSAILDDGCPNVSELYPWQLMIYLQKANFTDNNGTFYQFTSNRDIRPSYKYTHVNGRKTKVVPVGSYYTNSSGAPVFSINDTAIMWNRNGGKKPVGRCSPDCKPGQRRRYRGVQLCCFMCVSCPFNSVSTGNNSQRCYDCSNETYSNDANTQCLPKVPDIFDYNSKTAVALSVLCIFGSTVSVASGLMFYWKRDTPLVMASSKTHSYAIAAALALGFQTVFFYIGYPTDISCKLKSIVAGLHVTFIISVFCAKLYIIRKLFNANVVTSSKKWFYKSWFAVCILTCLHFIYNIIYESLDPSEVVKDFSYIRILPVFCKTSDTKFLTIMTVCSTIEVRLQTQLLMWRNVPYGALEIVLGNFL